MKFELLCAPHFRAITTLTALGRDLGMNTVLAGPPSPTINPSDLRQAFLDFRTNGQLNEAVAFAVSALQAIPNSPGLWMEYGRVLKMVGLLDHATFCFHHAATLVSEHPALPFMLGHCLLEKSEGERESRKEFFNDIDLWETLIDINYVVEMFNTGIDLIDRGFFEESIGCYKQLIKFHPEVIQAHYCMGCSLLTLGRFEEAAVSLRTWFELSAKGTNQTYWWGEDLTDKVLYIYADHGLGDFIQFIRFLPIVASRCKKLVLSASKNLWRIVGDIPNVELSTLPPPHYDYICSLYMLPHVFGIDLPTLPNKVPYLHVEPEMNAHWKARLPQDGFRIGIAWQGNPASLLDKGRSMPLAGYAPIARLPGVHLVSIQMNFGLDQLEHLPEGMTVTTLGPDFNAGPDNVVDTAAVMQNLDLIISSDTSVPHIAGALGCPVWTVLKAAPDWRYMLDRDDSPWYPTMRLFRQKTAGDWDEVMNRIALEVSKLL